MNEAANQRVSRSDPWRIYARRSGSFAAYETGVRNLPEPESVSSSAYQRMPRASSPGRMRGMRFNSGAFPSRLCVLRYDDVEVAVHTIINIRVREVNRRPTSIGNRFVARFARVLLFYLISRLDDPSSIPRTRARKTAARRFSTLRIHEAETQRIVRMLLERESPPLERICTSIPFVREEPSDFYYLRILWPTEIFKQSTSENQSMLFERMNYKFDDGLSRVKLIDRSQIFVHFSIPLCPNTRSTVRVSKIHFRNGVS